MTKNAIRPAPLRSEVPPWALTPPPWLPGWPPTDVRSSPAVHAANPGEVLQRVRQAVRARHYSRRTEKAYVAWARRFLAFHDYQDPAALRIPRLTWMPYHPRSSWNFSTGCGTASGETPSSSR